MAVFPPPTIWTKEKWSVMLTLAMTHFCNGMVVSLQAPFYPEEAEKKGASGTEYGLVFGIFELTVFLVSPFFGKYLPLIGLRRGFCGGIATTGLMCVAFGFLEHIDHGVSFITLSLVLRVVEACGNAAFLAASFTVVALIFPDSVSIVFGTVEMSFGVGMILGPTVGGGFYEVGGFTLPFVVMGCILLVQAALSIKTLQTLENRTDSSPSDGFGILKALKIPSVLLAVLSVLAASVGVGAMQTTMERHLAQFDLSPVHVGMFFMLYGGSYALLNPLWGWVADNISSKLVILIGSFLLGLGFLLIGPVPGLGLKSSLSLCIVSVVLMGLGIGAQLVAAFSEAQTAAVIRGFPDTINTYALVSSIWTSAFALGAFVGPTAAGVLYDAVGFGWSLLFPICWNILVFHAALIGLVIVGIKKLGDQDLYTPIRGDDTSKEVNKLSGKDLYYQSDLYKPV